jgi:hypothetical protein
MRVEGITAGELFKPAERLTFSNAVRTSALLRRNLMDKPIGAANEQVLLLERADALLRSVQPQAIKYFNHMNQQYLARWDYPGALKVFNRWTGELVAQSQSGMPTMPAPQARHEVQIDGCR